VHPQQAARHLYLSTNRPGTRGGCRVVCCLGLVGAASLRDRFFE
jgi:hypothetical protein